MKIKSRPKIILVLGMHRSGTSLIAKLISDWGAYMGNDLMPANKYNQNGYWEYNPLVDFHERLLEKTNNKWYAPSEEINTKDLLSEFGDEARQLVNIMDQSESVWCWKDPRMPLFLDFWKEILTGREIIYIISNRSPNDIAASLLNRDKMPVSIALSLWEFTTMRIFQSLSKETDYKFIDYEKFILQPEIFCKELFNYLNNSCQLVRNQEVYKSMVLSVNKTLNHAKPGKVIFSPSHKKLQQIIENEHIPVDFGISEYELLHLKEIFSLYRKLGLSNQIFQFAQLFYKNNNATYDEKFSQITEVTACPQAVHFKFENPQFVNKLRFDPLNNYLQVQINSIYLLLHEKEIEVPLLLSSNALFTDNGVYLFDTKDPQIYIDFKKEIPIELDEVIIELNYIKRGYEALEHIFKYKDELISKQMEEIYQKLQECESLLLVNESLVEKEAIEEGKIAELQILVNDLAFSNKMLEEQNQLINESNRSLETRFIESHRTVDELTYQLKKTKQELNNLIETPGIRYFHKIMFSIKRFIPVGSFRGVLSSLRFISSGYILKHSDLFDEEYYLNNNPDVAESEMSAVKHYLLFGGFEGRDPSEKFNSSYYLEQNPDVKSSAMNPLQHYISYGKAEGRSIGFS